MRPTLAFLPLLVAFAAASPPLPEYRAPRTATPPRIDGRLNDPAWATAPLAGDFVFPWHREGRREQTRARLLWDDTHLYLAFECDDRHITARHTARAGRIPEDACV
ncbi:MAG: carbohydrate-binding family 9-like protein, partial [Opitutaceae bacterium]